MNPPVHFTHFPDATEDLPKAVDQRWQSTPLLLDYTTEVLPLNLSSSGTVIHYEVISSEHNNQLDSKQSGNVNSNNDHSNKKKYFDDEDLVGRDCSSNASLENKDSYKSDCSPSNSFPETDGECACNSDSDNKSILQEIVKDLFEELVMEHCFHAHRALKLGALVFEEKRLENLDKDEEVEKTLLCPNCKTEHEVKDYLNKLASCMNMQIRKSARSKTKANYLVDNDDVIDESAANSQKKKKPKRQIGKNGSKSVRGKTQSEKKGNSTSDQLCGKKMKNGKYCRQKNTCSRHFKSNQCKEQTLESFPMSSQTEEDIDSDIVSAERPIQDFRRAIISDSSANSTGIKLTIRNDGIPKKKKSSTKGQSHQN